MKILDWYIVKKYWASFFFTAFLFTMIALVIDFSEKAEKFVEASKTLSLGEILLSYHLNYIPFINGLLWPLFSLISVVFFTSRLAYNSEIISILNAGVSFNRLLRPYLIGAAALTILLLMANHFIIPLANKPKIEFERKYVKRASDRVTTGSNMHFFIAPNTKIFLRTYSPSDSLGYTFRLERFDGIKLVYLLKAQYLEWNKISQNSWKLRDYEIRTFTDSLETLTVYTGKELDTIINMNPADFGRFSKQKDVMTTPELMAFIAKEKSRGLSAVKDFSNEIQRRTADPFTILILTVIGVAIAARKVRGGMGLHLAAGISIGAIFVFLSKFSIAFSANPNIPSIVGLWIPNLVFGLIAYFLMRRSQQ